MTKAEYFREHAEFLSSLAGYLRIDDKNRLTLLKMSYYFEKLALSADEETRRLSLSENGQMVRGPLPLLCVNSKRSTPMRLRRV